MLADGGMGTRLIAAGMPFGASPVAWGCDTPDVLRAIHQAYADAGCRILTTNTFRGSRTALAEHGLADQTDALNCAAAQMAQLVAQDGDAPCWVAADVGPFGGFLEPLGDTTPAQLRAVFVEQLRALRKGGADVVVIETMSDPAEVAVAIDAAREVADWPVIATYAFERQGEDFRTMMGIDAASAMRRTIDAGADVVGANCGTGLTLDDYVQLAEQLVVAAGSVPVIVQPNAGPPRMIDDQSVYDATPSQMAATATELIATGVRIIGGCCGTEPEHLAAMADALRENVP